MHLEDWVPVVTQFGLNTERDAYFGGDISFIGNIIEPITINNGTDPITPTVPLTGLVNIMGHIMFLGDDDGDGDYDYDIRFKDNAYLPADGSFHFRPRYPQGGSELGRTIIDADTDGNWILSGLNFSGLTGKDLIIGRYNGTTSKTQWAKFDESASGNLLLGGTASENPAAPIHVKGTVQTMGFIESNQTTSRMTFRASGTSSNTAVGIGATGDSLILRAAAANIGTVSATGIDITGLVQADSLRIDQTPTAEVIVPTHTVTISVNGTNYKVPIVAA